MKRYFYLVLFIVILNPFLLNAQSITGRLIDQNGNSLSGLQLQLHIRSSKYSAVSASNGSFTFNNIVGIEENKQVPSDYAVSNNYPNPFNPKTRIGISLAHGANVRVEVYNTIGQKVISEIERYYNSGTSFVDLELNGLPNGLYLARITFDGKNPITKKMMLMYGSQHLSSYAGIPNFQLNKSGTVNNAYLITSLDSVVVTGFSVNRTVFKNLPTLVQNTLDLGNLTLTTLPTNGLIAAYPFSGNANDVSGNAYNAIVNNAIPASDRFGNSNSAYSFDGSSSYLQTNINGSITDLTYSLWVYSTSTSTSGDRGVIILNNQTGFGWGYDEDFYYYTPSDKTLIKDPDNSSWFYKLPKNSWQHVAVTYSNSGVKFYHNGKLIQLDNVNAARGSGTLFIGKGNFPVPTYMSGYIDDVRIYNRVLSESEITQLAGKNVANGLIAYYPFDGNSLDKSGNDYNGTTNTGSTWDVDRFNNSGKALKVDGATGYFSVNNFPILDKEFTINLWLKPTGQFNANHNYIGSIISYGELNGHMWNYAYDNYLKQWNFWNNPTGSWTTSYNITDWVNLTILVNNNKEYLYVNGTLQNSRNITTPLLAGLSQTLRIGKLGGSYQPFNGLIDEVRIYNKALSEAEIKQLYDANTTPSNACPGIPTVLYEGKTYNTVKIGNQCWLKENLNVGSKINVSQNPSNNGTIEKYCYNDLESNCDLYGGLYQWNEAMQYALSEKTRGICPSGWHIPSQAEFQTLQSNVNNDGNALKAIGQGSGNGAGTNTSGFAGLLSGNREYNGTYVSLNSYGLFWSSKAGTSTYPYIMILPHNSNSITLGFGGNNNQTYAFSVRCIKDEVEESFEGTIGSGGGIIQASNSNPTLKGTYVEIPAGALTVDTQIKVKLSTNTAPNDKNAIVVKFEPDGLKFNKVIKLGLPYDASITDTQNLQAFYLNSDSMVVQRIPIESIDNTNHVITINSDHFSEYYSTTRWGSVWADIKMFNNSGKISAKVKLYGKNYAGESVGFKYGIPLTLTNQAATGITYAGQAFEEYIRNDGNKMYSVFYVTLKEDISFWSDPVKADNKLVVKRDEIYNNTANGKQVISLWSVKTTGSTNLFTSAYITTEDLRQKFYSGEPIVFKFDNFTADPNKKYYVEVEWATAIHPDAYWLSRLTPIYKFTNYEDHKLASSLPALTSDNDSIPLDDDFQNLVKSTTLTKPTLKSPANNSGNVSTSPTLQWNASTDAKTYYLKVWRTDNGITAVEKLTIIGTSQSISGLENSVNYSWLVIASNDNGVSDPSETWSFTTIAGKPNIPTLSSPEDGAIDQSTSPILQWEASTGATSYTLQVSANSSFSSFVYNQSGLTSSIQQINDLSNNSTYYWRVKATNSVGSSDFSIAWSFKTDLPPKK